MSAAVVESINAMGRMAAAARKMERENCMRAMCWYCAENRPAERMQSSITNKWYWVHGHPLDRCDAGPIRDLDAAIVQQTPQEKL